MRGLQLPAENHLNNLNVLEKGGTGACVRCEEAGTRPSARVGLAMSVFTHGVTTKGKPRLINHNQVFTVASRRKMLRRLPRVDLSGTIRRH